MVSRRAFLRGGLVAGVATSAPIQAGRLLPRAGADHPATTEVFCDTRYAEGDQFLQTLAAEVFSVHGTTTDPAALLALLPSAMGKAHHLVGLTSDAAFVIVEQIALSNGYEVRFQGIHRHLDEQQITHEVRGDPRLITPLAENLELAAEAWPGLVARALLVPQRLAAANPENSVAGQRLCKSCSPRPEGSPGHLVSWLLTPAA